MVAGYLVGRFEGGLFQQQGLQLPPRLRLLRQSAGLAEPLQWPYLYGLSGSDFGNLDTYGDGIAQLTAERRREEYVHDGDFLSDQYDTVVAANARLEDIEVVYGLLGYNTKLRACNGRLWPQRVQREKNLITVQLFNWVETYTRCIKLELRQKGSDVVARAGGSPF